jgi:hypothetical protein
MRFSSLKVLITVLFISFLVLSASSTPAQQPVAQETSCATYTEIALSHPMSRRIQGMIGFNALTAWISEKVIEHQLKKKIQGHPHVELKSYSGLDLMGGKVQQLNVHGEHVVLDHFIPITSFHLFTSENTPIFIRTKSRVMLLRPVQARFEGVLSVEDLNQLFVTEKGKQYFSRIPFEIPPIGKQTVDLLNPKISIRNNQLILDTVMNISNAPQDKGIHLMIAANIVSDKKQTALRLDRVNIQMDGVDAPPAMEDFIETAFGKILNASKLKIKKHKMVVQFDNPTIEGNALHIAANITISPKLSSLDCIKALESKKDQLKKSQEKATSSP